MLFRFPQPFPLLMPRFRILLLLAASLLVLPARAQPQPARVQLLDPRFAFSPEGTYDASIPSPADFLGYEPGTQFTFYADAVAYLKALAAASDRVTMHAYGRTHEGRPLHYLVIATPAHHARIDEIRRANLRLADPQALSEAEAEALLRDHPVLTWLSYSVHGNEASSTEAALQVAYRLAAGQDEAVTSLLAQSVVLLDPCINPDGRDRYVYWYRSMQSARLSTDQMDLEHDEPWPGGRTNHYWFDLNRDWVWLVHPESQGRIAAYQHWLPQVHVDYHEQGFNANYFTMPGTTPRNLLLPDDYERWSDAFGRGNIAAFDRHQISYFTREAFDFFYPGYGSSYPSTMGAIGMLTEQGGHSRGGRAVETEDGYALTLRQRIFDHYTTSLAAIKTAAENREGLLRYFRAAFSQATNKGEVAAYLFPDAPEGYLYDVIGMLMQHGVRVERAAEAFTVADARDYWDDAPQRRTFDAGTLLVFTDQPRHLFVNTVLQRRMAIEDSVMYDMATWSAPLAYNLDAYHTATKPRVPTTLLAEAPQPPAGLTNPNAAYAYVIDWRQRHAPKALAKLWEAGYRVRAARKPFNDGTRAFSEGTLIILLGRNPDRRATAAEEMQRIAEEAGVVIIGMDTGRMAEGIDLASRDSRPVKQPKALLLLDAPFSSYTAGQLWYLFDRETGLGLTRLRADALRTVQLGEYDVLILPGAGNLKSVLDTTQTARLKAWVQEGGTLVATEGSALFLTKDQSGLTAVQTVQDEQKKKDDDEAKAPEPAAYTPYAARRDSTGLARIPGSALRGILDPTNPLAFGLPARLYSLVFNAEALTPSEQLQTAGYYDQDAATLLAAGYASPKNLRKLAGNAFAAVQPMGRGKVVFLVDNTQYRMFWVGPARMMQNAVMLLPGM